MGVHDRATCLAPPMDSLLWHDGQAMLAFILLTRASHDNWWLNRMHVPSHRWIAMDQNGDWFSFNMKPNVNNSNNTWGASTSEVISARYLVSMKVVPVRWEFTLMNIKKPAGEGDSRAG